MKRPLCNADLTQKNKQKKTKQNENNLHAASIPFLSAEGKPLK